MIAAGSDDDPQSGERACRAQKQAARAQPKAPVAPALSRGCGEEGAQAAGNDQHRGKGERR